MAGYENYFNDSTGITYNSDGTMKIEPIKGLGSIENNSKKPTVPDVIKKDTGFSWDTGIKGLEAVTGLGKLALGYEQYGLAKDTFKFNKDMKTKEYVMAKDAYDRNKKRAVSIGNQATSYGSNAPQQA